MERTGGVSREHDPSVAQKAVFWLLHLGVVAVCAWLTFGGWSAVGAWAGADWSLTDPLRARILLGCAALYLVRHGITLFYLLERRVDWGEALGLAVFMALFEIGLLLVGGGALRDHAVPLGLLDGLAFGLLAMGSFLNTGSEVQRKLWKRDPAHRGHCYTGGLFSLSMHVNFFGDVVLFSGWCLLTSALWTLLLPLFMLLMFAFVHVPSLDAYLADRYGAEFEAYAARTRRLIPFVW